MFRCAAHDSLRLRARLHSAVIASHRASEARQSGVGGNHDVGYSLTDAGRAYLESRPVNLGV
jgi:hypothetical protein